MQTMLTVLALLATLVLLTHACRLLIADARAGVDLSMGAESLFSHLWLFAGVLTSVALILQDIGGVWLVLVCVPVFYLLSLPVRRLIKAIFLGADVPVEQFQHRGFAKMNREAEARKQQND